MIFGVSFNFGTVTAYSDFSNSDYCLYSFVFQHYKDTTIFANHQFFRLL